MASFSNRDSEPSGPPAASDGPLSSPAKSATEESGRPEVITLVTPFDPDSNLPDDEGQDAIVSVLSGPSAGASYVVPAVGVQVGREQSVDICIADPGLSRRHAEITAHGSRVYVTDLGSTNGTYVNGNRIRQRERLREGDRLQLGQCTVLQLSLQDRLERQACQRQYELTVRDGLTGLYNRRYLDERFVSEFAYVRRHHSDLALIIIDVDHFKQVNDTWGHTVGDDVLCAVARGIAHITRAEDLVARYGGEEFLVLARGIDANCALSCAERIRIYLAGLAIPVDGSADTVTVTVSSGVAHTEVYGYRDAEEMVVAADRALYTAKRSGRNRVELAEGPAKLPLARPRRRRDVRVMTTPLLDSDVPGLLDPS